MLDTQKITAHVPKELLESARKATGKGITETVKKALEELVQRQACANLRALRGKLHLEIDPDWRKDREFDW